MRCVMSRDLYIDFARGAATLSVIFIHTAYWSGQLYVPLKVSALSLVFDVAIFFAISGITSGANVEKTLQRLLKLQVTYMIFVTFLFFLDYLLKVFGQILFSKEWLEGVYLVLGPRFSGANTSLYPQWHNLGNWYLHRYSKADSFPVVTGSFWFLEVYFSIAVFGVVILRFFSRHIDWFIGICIVITLLFSAFPVYCPVGQAGYVAFYLAVFLMGSKMSRTKISAKAIVVLYLLVGVAILWMFWFYGKYVIYDIAGYKFPPRLPYIIWTSFSLVTLFALRGRLVITKENFVTHIGRNAIFFYFAQGISSSLIFYPVVLLKDNVPWWFLLVGAYGSNVIMACVISDVLKRVDAMGWWGLKLLRKKTAM